jgi:hypothetical protein
VNIHKTAPLQWDSGGVVDLNLADWSHLNLLGGEIANLHISGNAIGILRGGRIDNLDSWQTVSVIGRDPQSGEWFYNRHIEMFVKDYTYNSLTKVLKGTWGDNSLFKIQLIDRTQYGYSPAIDNIKFTIIPEPMSLILLALGGMVIRRR